MKMKDKQPRNDLLDDITASIPGFDAKDRYVFRKDISDMPKDDIEKLMTYVERVKTLADVAHKNGQQPYYAWITAFINFYDDIVKQSEDTKPADFYMDIFMGLLDRGLTAGNAFRYTNKAYNKVCEDPSLIKNGKYPTLDDFFPRKEDDRKK